MKSQRSRNKLVLMLKRKTIANLNPREMVQARSGDKAQAEETVKVQETDPLVCEPVPSPVPTDMGIAPNMAPAIP